MRQVTPIPHYHMDIHAYEREILNLCLTNSKAYFVKQTIDLFTKQIKYRLHTSEMWKLLNEQ